MQRVEVGRRCGRVTTDGEPRAAPRKRSGRWGNRRRWVASAIALDIATKSGFEAQSPSCLSDAHSCTRFCTRRIALLWLRCERVKLQRSFLGVREALARPWCLLSQAATARARPGSFVEAPFEKAACRPKSTSKRQTARPNELQTVGWKWDVEVTLCWLGRAAEGQVLTRLSGFLRALVKAWFVWGEAFGGRICM